MKPRYFTLFLCTLVLGTTFAAPDKKDKHSEIRLEVPIPDVMPSPLVPEVFVPSVREINLHVAHHVSSLYGIDVSHYQGAINWQMVATDEKVKFVYIKATEGSDLVDKYYRKNLQEAQLAGIPVGVYHFYRPNASVMTQMRNLTDNVDFRKHNLLPIIDVESRGKGSLQSFQGKLLMFLDQIERAFGIRPIIYTGQNFYNEHLAGAFLKYNFMIAKYAEDPPELIDEANVLLWQFTSKGHVNGINGDVDRSVFLDNHTLQEILK